MLIVLQILENILLLGFMGLGFFFVERNRTSLGTIKAHMLNGLCLGLITFLVTTTPVTLSDGATVDARAGPVILAGVLAGPVGGVIAAVMGGLARGWVGGSFAASGVAVYAVYALIGVSIGRLQLVDPDQLLKPRTIIILGIASFFGAGAMFFIISPMSRAVQWLQLDLPYILVANALSITYTAIILGIAGIFLKKSEELNEINETLKLAKRAGKFGIWDFDIETGILKWDDRSRKLHGVADTPFEGSYEDWTRNVHPDDLSRAQDAFAQALTNEKVFDTEYRVLHPDGQIKTIKGDAIVIRDGAGKAVRVVGTNLDLTDIRTTEAKLAEARSVAVQAQKFDTIGQLTGGVAHDFNNLLAVVLGNLEHLKDEIQTNPINLDEVSVLTEASIEATRRGADLTQNMLAYARKAQLTPESVNLNAIVRETEKWMRRTIESRIEIDTVLQAGLWPTRADKSSLQSALVNLLVNARDAIDGSGKITIETSNTRVDQEYVMEKNEDIHPGRYVMLAVADTGMGMTPEISERILDAFFTTKIVGKGVGLGLSMVQGFVKQSGGAVRVNSEPGEGTTVKLYFPADNNISTELPTTDASFESRVAAGQSSKRILLVEDREEVMLILQKTLLAAGYDVVTAESGDVAFERFTKEGQFDLVITDIVMPGNLQGPSLAKQIRSSHPDMRFIFLSGYASEATVHGNGLAVEDIRLMKPVSRFDLIKAVEECLALAAAEQA